MVVAVREGIFQILRVQGITVMLLYLLGPTIIGWLEISPKYVHLYYIDLIGVAAQVLMLAVLNVSLHLGPVYYGYGFGLSMTITAFVGIFRLSAVMDNLEYETFMADRREKSSSKFIVSEEPAT